MTDRLNAPLARTARSRGLSLCAAVLSALMLGPLPAAGAAGSPPDVALQVSFEPAAAVRLAGGRFVASARADGAAINEVVGRHDVVRVERLFEEPEASLAATRRRLLGEGHSNVPDLNRHFRIVAGDRAGRDRLRADLRALRAVDQVVDEPRPAPPAAADYTAQQRYAHAAPVGIGAGGVAGRAGGVGENVKIIDIEYSWNTAHEDLAAAAAGLIANGTPVDPFNDSNHGTAVLGELVATPNAFGVTGLAAGAGIGMVNANTTTGYALANAVNLARLNLSPGDVVLIEQQAFGVSGSGTQGDAYVPAEYVPAVYDAIRLATQSEINVVEAAGNGGVDLDAPAYGARFPQGKPDSDAVIAGAGGGDCSLSAHARMPYSTYGTRVNLQGWGQCVTTTGYGTLFDGGVNARYASSFNGTSSAAPIVASAIALYSSAFKAAAGGRAPSPLAVRNRLIATGTPQAASPAGHIGPLPDIVAALTDFDFTPPAVSVTAGPAGPTNDATPSFAFTASEAGSTFACRIDDGAFATCTSPHTVTSVADGPHSFEVRATDAALNPGPATARAFRVDSVAPATSISGGPSGSISGPQPTFTFSSGEAGVRFACRAGSPLVPGAFAACSSPFTTAPLADGGGVFEVRAADAAGNVGPAASRTFTVDAVGPTVSITDGPPPTTTTANPTFAFASSEAGSTFACRAGAESSAGVFVACASPHTTAALAVGASVFEVRATDAHGNTGPVAALAFTVAAQSRTLAPAAAIAGSADPPAREPPAIGAGTRLTVRADAAGRVRLSRPTIRCPASAPTCVVSAKVDRVGAGNPRIGAATARIAPGMTATIRFRLTKGARVALRRQRRLKAIVRITATHGAAVRTRRVQVTLERRR